MKKIILFLALALGVEVNAQVVGGYLPVNSTKSATMGGLRVNGTSTFTGNALFSSSVGIGALPNNALSVFQSVKGTGSVNIGESVAGFGALWFDTPVSASNYALRGNAANTSINAVTRQQHNINNTTKGVWTSTGLRIGSSSDPSAVLDVTGDAKVSSTFSLGSANLTGGNTGTVAVLSDVVFGVNCQVSSSNPADATSYTCGIVPFSFTGFNTGKVYIPYNCTLVGWTFSAFTNGTPGSAESGSLSININGTATQLSSAIITSVAVVEYSASGLSTSVTAGNYINAIYTTPTWGTNPTSMALGVTFWFVRRS